MSRKAIFTIAFLVMVSLFVFLFFYFSIPTRIKIYKKLGNTKSVLNAEVLNWDPKNSTLSFKYTYNNSLLSSKTVLTPQDDSILLSSFLPKDCTTIIMTPILNSDDLAWERMFHPGDTIQLKSGEIALANSRLPESVDVFGVINTTLPKCEKL